MQEACLLSYGESPLWGPQAQDERLGPLSKGLVGVLEPCR
jgi:hypothetical protein